MKRNACKPKETEISLIKNRNIFLPVLNFRWFQLTIGIRRIWWLPYTKKKDAKKTVLFIVYFIVKIAIGARLDENYPCESDFIRSSDRPAT